MVLIETTVTATSVRMRYADQRDATKATRWLDFQVPLDGLKLPLLGGSRGEEEFGDDPNLRILAEVHLAALHRARAIIGDEMQRFGSLRDPTLRS